MNNKRSEYNKQYYLKNKDSIIKEKSEFYKNNKKAINQQKLLYKREKRKDPIYKLAFNLRSRFNKAFKGDYKSGSAVRDLGCSIIELKTYLESKFQLGMSWTNYGIQGWHIDHIIPLNSFDLSSDEQVKQACHYSNLQPLWAKDNLRKGSTTSVVKLNS